ncbi:hypothetical protein B7463_g12706, partial [Scytalidium lignicola]
MSPKLPARSAGPDEVRAYIVRVLMSQHDITSDAANETAGLWRLGRGSELRDASVQVFKSIFGDYTGWFLFRIVHENELEDWQQSAIGMISFYTLIGSIILAALLVLRVLVLHALKGLSLQGLKKASFPIFQALLVMGLFMLNYGLLMPGSNGVAIAICGSMISVFGGFVVLLYFIPQVAGQVGAKYAPVGGE